MSLKIDISLCRVCCKSEATHSIFKYAKNFHYCTSIEVTQNDGLPDKICELCLGRMRIAVEFKKKSQFSDMQLKKFIASVNNQFMALEGPGNDDDGEDEERGERQAEEAPEEEVVPKNSGLGHGNDAIEGKRDFDKSPQKERESEAAEISPSPDPEPEPEPKVVEPDPEPESEPEQEPEKFRAVAVIQEKPAAKPENNAFEVVQVEYEESLPQQEEVMEVEEHESDQQNQLLEESDVDLEQQEQVYYIGFTTEFHEEEEEEEEDVQVQEDEEITEKRDELTDVSEMDHSYRQSRYATLTKLESSMSSTKSSVERPHGKFECVECAKSFSTKTNLNRHLLTHNGNKPYVCPLCEKGFTQSGSLKQHLLIHQNLRPYVCKVCSQGFTQQKSLTFHMRRHTNEKPFVCPFCSYAFRQKDGLKRHVLVKHTEKDHKTFRCELCGYVFQSRYALSMHRRQRESGVNGSCQMRNPSADNITVSVEMEPEEVQRDEVVGD